MRMLWMWGCLQLRRDVGTTFIGQSQEHLPVLPSFTIPSSSFPPLAWISSLTGDVHPLRRKGGCFVMSWQPQKEDQKGRCHGAKMGSRKVWCPPGYQFYMALLVAVVQKLRLCKVWGIRTSNSRGSQSVRSISSLLRFSPPFFSHRRRQRIIVDIPAGGSRLLCALQHRHRQCNRAVKRKEQRWIS
jgi:hypothetical protein